MSYRKYIIFGGISGYFLTGLRRTCPKPQPENQAGICDIKKLYLLSAAFGRPLSRWIGKCLDVRIPQSLKKIVYPSFVKLLDIDISECALPLEAYASIGEIFSRTLKRDARKIENTSDKQSLVCPCDGIICNLCSVTDQSHDVEQCATTLGPIKGATFLLEKFLGTKISNSKTLYCAIVYLSPRNYHHFHSPCDLEILERRHFSGFVLPVFSGLAKRVNDLFAVNERVILKGLWDYGEFYYGAIAAFNVADIRLDHEPLFCTNLKTKDFKQNSNRIDTLTYPEDKKVVYKKGEKVGGFHLGSTVVILFEAPEGFSWSAKIGDSIKAGQLLGRVNSKPVATI